MLEPGVNERQQEHTDVGPPFELGSNTKHFHMVGLTAIDNQSFLGVQPVGMEPMIVLIEKGDTLLMRHDIPHAGAENLTERKNVRLHFFRYYWMEPKVGTRLYRQKSSLGKWSKDGLGS